MTNPINKGKKDIQYLSFSHVFLHLPLAGDVLAEVFPVALHVPEHLPEN